MLSVFILVMSVSVTAIYDPNNTQDNSNDKVKTMLAENSSAETANNSSQEDTDAEITTTSSGESGVFQRIIQALFSLF